MATKNRGFGGRKSKTGKYCCEASEIGDFKAAKTKWEDPLKRSTGQELRQLKNKIKAMKVKQHSRAEESAELINLLKRVVLDPE
jgi:hypothetical protein